MNKIKASQKLLFKISCIIGAATLLTLIVVGFSSSFFTGVILQSPIRENALQIAKHTMDKIDRLLYERYLDIQAIAGEGPFRDYLQDYIQGSSDDYKLKNNFKRLQDLAIVSGPWNTLFVVDPQGTIVLSTIEEEVGKSIDRWYYKNIAFGKALRGEVNHSDFVVLKHTGEPTVVFAAPVINNNNPAKPVIGAVVGDLAWMSIVQVLEDVTNHSVILLNREGEIIAQNTLYTQTGARIDQRQGKSMVDKVDREGSHSMIIHRSQGIVPEETLVSLAGQRGYLSYKGSGWVLVSSELIRSAFTLANSSARSMAFILLPVILLMSAGILFSISRIVVHPIVILTQTVRDISSGDLTKQALVVSNDEVGQLAVAFNDMTKKLKESYESLEEKIELRTAELRESRESIRSIIETATDAFVSIDTNGSIVDWNRQSEIVFGWTRSEVVGKLLAEIIIPLQYREAHRKGLKHFMATGQGPVLGKTIELSALHRNGNEFPIEITIWPIQVKGGCQFNAFIRDISARKMAEKKLRGILEGAPNAMVIVNKEGEIVLVNTQTEKIFGYERKDLIGKPVEILVPKRFQNVHIDHKRGYFMDPHVRPMGSGRELYGMKKDGREFPVEISLSPLDTEEGVLVIGAINDITGRKNIENKLKTTYKDLEEREKSLRNTFSDLQKTHDELKQTQNQLLQSEKLASIGQLAAGVAHEINNPVGFINNNMEILGQYIADYGKILRMVENLKAAIEQENLEKAKSVVQEMAQFEKEINLDYIINDINNLLQHNQRGIERIQKIVLDLRTFAREDKETMDLVRIEEVIDSILSIVHNEIKYKAELTKSYGDTPLVKCSPQRLGQVFINLLMNAVQAIEEKGTIEVKTYRQGEYVCVDVIDTGKGIEEKNLRKIFDPFFTTKPAGQGTGLGLSVSYEIVKKHGGEIRVQSQVGEGTTFTVMLPIN